MTITANHPKAPASRHKDRAQSEAQVQRKAQVQTALPQAIEEALLDCCRLCLASSESTELHDTDDALWFDSGVAFPMYNGIYRPHFAAAGDDPDALADAMAALIAPFKAAKRPMVVSVGPMSHGQPLHDAIGAQGLWKVASIPGMAVHLDDIADSWLDVDLDITQVTDEADLRQWVAVQNDSFGFPHWVADVTFAMTRTLLATPDGPVRFYLGRTQGVPVATSMAVDSGENIGIFNVACAPEARRRGFGAAITAAPLLEGRQPGGFGILHATPEGLPLYEKMGFATHCHIDNYLYAPLSTLASLAWTTITRKIAHAFRKPLPRTS